MPLQAEDRVMVILAISQQKKHLQENKMYFLREQY